MICVLGPFWHTFGPGLISIILNKTFRIILRDELDYVNDFNRMERQIDGDSL